MTTLSELKTKYAKHPVTLAAIERAIAKHGASAEAVMTSGLPSTTAKQSNMVKRAASAGFKEWEYFAGARAGKYANDGCVSVIVKIS